MPRKGHSPNQILNKLRQVEVTVANGKRVGGAEREIGVSGNTYYRWRQEYDGLNVDQARRLKKLKQENARLSPPEADKPFSSPQVRGTSPAGTAGSL